MIGVEEIISDSKPIAIIFRSTIPVENDIAFLTDHANSFQVGIHHRKKGIALKPHSHRIDKPLQVNDMQEILYVVSGKIEVTFYHMSGTVIDVKTLTTGDSVLLIAEGHGVTFLEDSRVFEIKQGPYPGQQNAKNFVPVKK